MIEPVAPTGKAFLKSQGPNTFCSVERVAYGQNKVPGQVTYHAHFPPGKSNVSQQHATALGQENFENISIFHQALQKGLTNQLLHLLCQSRMFMESGESWVAYGSSQG